MGRAVRHVAVALPPRILHAPCLTSPAAAACGGHEGPTWGLHLRSMHSHPTRSPPPQLHMYVQHPAPAATSRLADDHPTNPHTKTTTTNTMIRLSQPARLVLHGATGRALVCSRTSITGEKGFEGLV
jgi:hypothetical protein